MIKRFVAPMAAAMLLAGGAAFAQGATSGATGEDKAGATGSSTMTTTTQQTSSSAMPGGAGMSQMTAETLLDMKVANPQGDKIGEVEDLVLNPQNGQVFEVVVSVGGFLGIGDKKVALPWNQMQINQDRKELITQASKEQLQQAQAWHDPTEQQARTPESRSGTSATPPSGSAGSSSSGAR